MLGIMLPHVRSHGPLWRLAILAVVSLSVLHTVASAETMYRFIDQAGVIHFSNAPTDPRYKKIVAAQTQVRQSRTVTVPSLHEMIQRASHTHSLSPALLHAVIRVESGYDSNAVSPKGAMGLMQLMPGTASMLNVTNPYDPLDNISGGARHLRYLLDRFGGNVELALAAYNAGEARVLRDNQVPQISETRQYVHKVLRVYRDFARQEIVTRRFVNYLRPN